MTLATKIFSFAFFAHIYESCEKNYFHFEPLCAMNVPKLRVVEKYGDQPKKVDCDRQ
jgi:hypothetical protein